MNQLLQGDCLDVMRGLPDNSVDAIVTDPPAGIAFMGKDWDKDKGGRHAWIAWMESVARECLRVLKPGGHALVWAIPRTSHWTGLAWEEAGFEPRDKLYHCFGSGFPKSLNLGNGWGTALKPAIEEWWLFRRPISESNIAANVLRWGTGGINVDGARVETSEIGKARGKDPARMKMPDWRMTGGSTGSGASNPQGRFPSQLIHDGSEEVVGMFPETTSGGGNKASSRPGMWAGKKPFDDIREIDSGSAARFFKACPDDDPEDAEARRLVYVAKASKADRDEGLDGFEERVAGVGDVDESTGRDSLKPGNQKPGGARLRVEQGLPPTIPRRNFHPTVKPTDLMRYLCRLITPPGGIVLDPFMGSGSTGKGAVLEGFQFIGIEQDAEYLEIARARIAAAVARSQALSLEQRVAWLETQVQAQGAKLRKLEAVQQMSLFDVSA